MSAITSTGPSITATPINLSVAVLENFSTVLSMTQEPVFNSLNKNNETILKMTKTMIAFTETTTRELAELRKQLIDEKSDRKQAELAYRAEIDALKAQNQELKKLEEANKVDVNSRINGMDKRLKDAETKVSNVDSKVKDEGNKLNKLLEEREKKEDARVQDLEKKVNQLGTTVTAQSKDLTKTKEAFNSHIHKIEYSNLKTTIPTVKI